MNWRHRVAGLAGLALVLCLAPDAHAFPRLFHHYYYMAPSGAAVSQGAFPWQIVPPLLQLGQQLLGSGNLNLPDLSGLAQPNSKIVNPATKTAIDKTGTQLKTLLDKLDSDLPDLRKDGKTSTGGAVASPKGVPGPGG